jgi:hypothetical protein
MKYKTVIRIFNLYGKNFGYIRTTIKLLSYEFRSLNKELCGSKVIVDLGSGEGLLSAMLKASNPQITFVCVDFKKEFIDFISHNNSVLGMECLNANILNVSSLPHGDFYLLNDVLHHIDSTKREEFLGVLIAQLSVGQKILIRDVRRGCSFDYLLTKNVDKKLYPSDPLSYFNQDDWVELLSNVTKGNFRIKKFFLGWPSNKLQVLIWK